MVSFMSTTSLVPLELFQVPVLELFQVPVLVLVPVPVLPA